MTTAAKRASDAKAFFRRFTDSLVELLEHPETPTTAHDAFVDAVAGTNNATQAASGPKDFDRLVLERAFGLKGRKTPPALRPAPPPTRTCVRWTVTSLAHLADQLWSPSTISNIADETRAELLDDLTPDILTF